MGLWPVRGEGVHASQGRKASGASEEGRWRDGPLFLQRDPRSAVLAALTPGRPRRRTWHRSCCLLGPARGQSQEGGSRGRRKSRGCSHVMKTELAQPGAYFFWFWCLFAYYSLLPIHFHLGWLRSLHPKTVKKLMLLHLPTLSLGVSSFHARLLGRTSQALWKCSLILFYFYV